MAIGCDNGSKETMPIRTPVANTPPISITQQPHNEMTLIPSVTATIPSDLSEIKFNCLKIQNNNFQTIYIGGTIALISIKDINTTEESLLLWNLNSGEQKILSTSLADRYSVSPKGIFLAFNTATFEGNQLKSMAIKIINSDGNPQTTINQQKDWYDLYWLNEEDLLVNLLIEKNPLVLLSPFENKQEIIEPFPTESVKPFDHELIYDWGFYAYHKLVYNGDRTRALYPFSENGEPRIAIHDMTANKDLAIYSTNKGWGVSPKWSPSGDQIAVALNTNSSFRTDGIDKYEIFIIGHDGDKLYSTNLSDFETSIYVSSLSWSPNGNYIAFWYTTGKSVHENLELAVLDIKTKKITNYCIIKNKETHSWKRNDISPIWSPDGSSLLIEVPDNTDQTPNSIIVDIVNVKAFLIKPGFIPVGWMK